MYQGSHLPNFEALGVPNSKRRGRTHTQTDGRTTPHRPIVKDFFETFTKMILTTAESRNQVILTPFIWP